MELRKAVFGDCELFNQWENDQEVIRFLTVPKDKTMEQSIREFLQREQDETVFDFMVVHEGKEIGRAYLSRYDKDYSSIDITRIYIGDRSMQGKGLGKALMKALMAFCFEELELNRVTLDFYDGNKAQGIYRALGFVDEGIAREAGYKDGEYHNFNLMSMLKREYQQQVQKENW